MLMPVFKNAFIIISIWFSLTILINSSEAYSQESEFFPPKLVSEIENQYSWFDFDVWDDNVFVTWTDHFRSAKEVHWMGSDEVFFNRLGNNESNFENPRFMGNTNAFESGHLGIPGVSTSNNYVYVLWTEEEWSVDKNNLRLMISDDYGKTFGTPQSLPDKEDKREAKFVEKYGADKSKWSEDVWDEYEYGD